MAQYFMKHYDDLFRALLEHFFLVAAAMACSLALAAVLTVAAVYFPKLGEALVQVFSVVYSVPSLALFAVLIPVTGLGAVTAVIVLTAYNQYLLLRNFIAGLSGVDRAAIEAARGLGMNTMQVLVKIQLPLSRTAIFTGIQLAAVSTVGIATIAAMINAGGLGSILFDGLRTLNVYKIAWGSILSAGLALGFHGLLQKVGRKKES